MPGVPDTNEPAWETFLNLLESKDEAPPSAQVVEEELKRARAVHRLAPRCRQKKKAPERRSSGAEIPAN